MPQTRSSRSLMGQTAVPAGQQAHLPTLATPHLQHNAQITPSAPATTADDAPEIVLPPAALEYLAARDAVQRNDADAILEKLGDIKAEVLVSLTHLDAIISSMQHVHHQIRTMPATDDRYFHQYHPVQQTLSQLSSMANELSHTLGEINQ